MFIVNPLFNVGAINKSDDINWELMSAGISTTPPVNDFPTILNGAYPSSSKYWISAPSETKEDESSSEEKKDESHSGEEESPAKEETTSEKTESENEEQAWRS